MRILRTLRALSLAKHILEKGDQFLVTKPVKLHVRGVWLGCEWGGVRMIASFGCS